MAGFRLSRETHVPSIIGVSQPMSEYQYFEFQAIDRQLSEAAQKYLRRYSTRATITSTSFTNEYHWGDFKGNSFEWVRDYFDAHLHYANWGTRQLAFRLPQAALSYEIASQFDNGETVTVTDAGDDVVIFFLREDLDGYDSDVEDWDLAPFLWIRSELARGDLRPLYLAWLAGIKCYDEDDPEEDPIYEPAIPPGLKDLTTSQQLFAEFIEADHDVIVAAAEASPPPPKPEAIDDLISRWIGELPASEKDALLTRFIAGDQPWLAAQLRTSIDRLVDIKPTIASRSTTELCKRAEVLREERQAKEARLKAEEAARKQKEAIEAREKYLNKLAGKEAQLWNQVDELVSRKVASAYDEALRILLDLRDLALRSGADEFAERFQVFRASHANKPAMMKRVTDARID